MSSETVASTMKQEATTALVPKLRFPEFRGAEGWQKVTLNSIADPVKERAVQSENNEVLSLSAEHGLVLQGNFFGKKVAGENIERYLKINRNDFVYNDRTTKASTYGAIKRLSRYASGIVSPIYKCFRFGTRENSVYWEWYFESGNHDAALRSLVNEGARAGRFNISISQFLSTIAYRPSLAEQQKIADCLSSLDELIAAQAQKVEALKAHRKGLMQQLFPREGETQPRLRFPEFQDAGEWEESSLGQRIRIASGQIDPKQPPYCHAPQVGSENIEPHSGSLVNLRSAKEKGVISGNYVFDENDILYSKIRPALNKVAIPAFKGICSADIYPIRPISGILLRDYLFYLLLSPAFLDYAIQNSERGKIPKINRYALVSFKTLFPPPDEQQRIVSCLRSLDTQIAAETQKLEALKSHKKGLMQQLFPSPNEAER